MKDRNRTSAPGFDVTNYGATEIINHFILERVYRNRLATLFYEKEALKKAGIDPNDLVPVERIGGTCIFTRVSFSPPILVNDSGEVLY